MVPDMASNIHRIADALGAKIVAKVPDTGGGAFGAARLGRVIASLQGRLEPGQGKRPGRPTVATWVRSPKVPMSLETESTLATLAAEASKDGRKVSPMQLAAQLLEEAVAKYRISS
jgi:hypothetical protein